MQAITVSIGSLAGACIGLAIAPGFAVVFVILGVHIFLLGEKTEAKPRYANLRLYGRIHLLPTKFLLAFRFTLLLGLGAALIFLPFIGTESAIIVGAIYAVVGGICFTLSDTIATPSIPADRSDRSGAADAGSSSPRISNTPMSTLRGDRAMTIVHVLGVGITYAVALGFAFELAPGIAVAVVYAVLVGSLGTALRIPLGPGGRAVRIPLGFTTVGSAWARFVVAKVYLALTRQLPWRLMNFLNDCHHLGLLKQEGPWYQFRHIELQDRLTR